MKLPRRLSLHAGFWLVLLLSTFAWAPATYPGYWQATEGFIPAFNISQPSSLATIATQPDVWRGMGSGTFLLGRPFLVFGMSPVAVVRISFILLLLLGGLGCYSWLQVQLGDRSAGLAGLVYLFFPPLLATIYVRGSLSDATVVMLFPLALAGLAAYRRQRIWSAAGIAVIAIIWMWQAQAGLALVATVLLFGYAIWVEQNVLCLLIVLISGVAGLVSLATVIDVHAPSPVIFNDHFVYPHQFLQQQWQFAPSIAGWQDRYPFQLGLIALLFSLFALWGLFHFWYFRLSHKQAGAGVIAEREVSGHDLQGDDVSMARVDHQVKQVRYIERLWIFSAVVIVLLTTMALPWSQPLWEWTHAERLFLYPWQPLLLTAPFWAVTAGSVAVVYRLFRQTPSWVVAAALIVLGSYPYLFANFTTVSPPERPLAIFGPQSEIVVLEVDVKENRQPRATELAITWQVLHPLSVDYNIFFQALRGDGGRSDAQSLSVVHQLDRQPLEDTMPATTWQPGKIYRGTYQLELPDVHADVPLTYYFGFYDWFDGSRLPVNWGADDKLIIYGQ